MATEKSSLGWARNDPRSSSQQSIPPAYNAQEQRRKLLLVYIHGFMGNEASFRSFPAHVHNLLTVFLANTHVVHTKIYPRYRSKRNIAFARDDFGKWLEPHESDTTDVVLLGHSMGGLLASEVVLAQVTDSEHRHRILGTINFDVPFLGMHPGVIKSGLASIFQPGEKARKDKVTSQSSASASSSTIDTLGDHVEAEELWSEKPDDPNFNPAFANDVVLPTRKGWKNALHWLNKHSGDLKDAAKQLVTSHMEFGGAMANYPELKARYAKVRALEEEDIRVRAAVIKTNAFPDRVRFANYYTICYGRPKKPRQETLGDSTSQTITGTSELGSGPSQISLSDSAYTTMSELSLLDQSNEEDRSQQDTIASNVMSASDALPTKPPPLDVSYIEDPTIRQAVEDEHVRAMKSYEEAIAAHKGANPAEVESTPDTPVQRDPFPLEQPKQKLSHSESEALRLKAEAERMAAEHRRLHGLPSPSLEPTESSPPIIATASASQPSVPASSLTSATTSTKKPAPPLPPRTPSATTSTKDQAKDKSKTKPKKDRHFCVLPPPDSSGTLDPTWVRVFMVDTDEVGAHCGLFVPDGTPPTSSANQSGEEGLRGSEDGEGGRGVEKEGAQRYERLVGDVAGRIEEWVDCAWRERVSTRER